MQDLVLDAAIRNWVLIPIVVITLLVTVARHYLMIMMQSDASIDFTKLQQQNTLVRAARLRQNGGFIPGAAFAMRKHYFAAKKEGVLCAKDLAAQAPNMMNQSNVMMESMKGQFGMIIPNMLMIGWLTYFFSGFVIVKLPFSLTAGFKVMLQRGVELSTLDTSYVSSLSFYFLVMFGLRGLLSLLIGQSDAFDEAKMMQAQMGMGAGAAAAQQFNAQAAYRKERDSLRLCQYKDVTAEAEQRLIAAFRASS